MILTRLRSVGVALGLTAALVFSGCSVNDQVVATVNDTAIRASDVDAFVPVVCLIGNIQQPVPLADVKNAALSELVDSLLRQQLIDEANIAVPVDSPEYRNTMEFIDQWATETELDNPEVSKEMLVTWNLRLTQAWNVEAEDMTQPGSEQADPDAVSAALEADMARLRDAATITYASNYGPSKDGVILGEDASASYAVSEAATAGPTSLVCG